MRKNSDHRLSLHAAIGLTSTILCLGSVWAQAGIQSLSGRPFVTGFTPVIGPGGGVVGGVSVDADGIVNHVEVDDREKLRKTWIQGALGKASAETDLRMVSLSRLDGVLSDLALRNEQPSHEVFLLAGLQRVDYVLVYPERNDVVLAGPAGAWHTNGLGDVVSVESRTPPLRLDDLIEALRSAPATRETRITCSIEPNAEGLRRYARARARLRSFDEAAIKSMENAIGPQQVLLGGVSPDSHFAQVMVAADYRMKRLAMGLDPSPVKAMPSYMDLLSQRPSRIRVTSPRWWMTAHFKPLSSSEDLLAWNISAPVIQTKTQDSLTNRRGERADLDKANPMAQRWADSMTSGYDDLAISIPVFAALRNCIDLSVVAALISKHDLLGIANCRLPMLLDAGRVRGSHFEVPKSVPSQATFVKGQNGWIVSVSGGVDFDPWSAVKKIMKDDGLKAVHAQAVSGDNDQWWW